MSEKVDTVGSFLVLGFVPENSPVHPGLRLSNGAGTGVHWPLRSDGYYSGPPFGVARDWRARPAHPRERVVIVRIVNDHDLSEAEEDRIYEGTVSL
jgi:hypothetical protein